MAVSIASSLPLIALSGCSPEAISFNSIDLTGAAYAKDFRLQDHNGNVRTLSDFREKIAVIFLDSRSVLMFAQRQWQQSNVYWVRKGVCFKCYL